MSDYEKDAGTGVFTFTVSLTNASYQDISVNYALIDGSATVIDSDYLPISGTLSIPSGQLTSPITVTVIGDTILEPDETFAIDLSSPTNAGLGNSHGIGTIWNDDPLPILSIADLSISEGNYGTKIGVLGVSLSIPSYQVITVDYQTANDIATIQNLDYLEASGTLTFTVGQTTQWITVTMNGDTKYELDETFLVNISNPINATLHNNQGIVTIENDDPLPSVPSGLFGVELNPLDNSGGLGWITPTITTWTKGVEISWSDIEPSQGSRNWNVLDGTVVELKNAISANLVPIVVVGGAPQWAQKYQSPIFAYKTCGPVYAASNFSIGCYCPDESRCHRSVMRELLEERGASLV